MSVHCQTFVDKAEQLVSNGTAADLGVIPANACEGQMTFLKRSTGDIIYVGVAGKIPTDKNYDYILTDDIPFYQVDMVKVGAVRAKSSVASSTLSTNITGNVR